MLERETEETSPSEDGARPIMSDWRFAGIRRRRSTMRKELGKKLGERNKIMPENGQRCS